MISGLISILSKSHFD